ncbi:alpha/beta hydrolase family protein [Corynebacterium provencense]|uniref:alpha/beta hydrolase family protein n=1 Tax=Corynebacterium provencense TaxID=1737425 RepID=UPI0021C393C4|nr:alpha/beta hydrolase [Corynebacterium provencense]
MNSDGRISGVRTSHSPTSRAVSTVDLELPGTLPRPDGSPSTLRGSLDLPPGSGELTLPELRAARVSVAVVAHCFTCSRRAPGVFRISRALARAGIACMRFDFPGLGDSVPANGGVAFEDTTFSSNVADLLSVSGWLDSHLSSPSLLVGHSLGGAAVLRAAHRIPSLKAVVTVGAPFLPGRAAASLLDAFTGEQAPPAETAGPAETADPAGRQVPLPGTGDDTLRTVHLAGRDLTFRRRFLTDLAENSVTTDVREDIAAVGRRGVPLLVMHSPTDQTVPVTDATEIFSAASWPKSLLSIPDADHLLTRRGSAQWVGETVARWAGSVGVGGHTTVGRHD